MHPRRRRRIFGAGAHARARNAEGRRIAARRIAGFDRQARGLGAHLRSFAATECGRWWNRRLAIAAITTEDPYAGLPEASELGSLAGDLRLYSRRHSRSSTRAARIQAALDAEEAALSWDPRITNSEGASFSAYTGGRVFANSRGFAGQLSHQQLLVERDAGGAAGRFHGARLLVFARRAAIPSWRARRTWDAAPRSEPCAVWARAKSRRRKRR